MEEAFCEVCSPSRSGLQPFRFFIDNTDPDCPSCRIISDTLRFFYPPTGPRQKILLHPEAFRGHTSFLALSDPDDGDLPSRIVYYVRSKTETKLLTNYIGRYFERVYCHRDLDVLPSGKASLEQILAWDDVCRSQHPRCSFSLPLLPTRVIDVSPSNGNCRLYESTGENMNYMALSHCWGSLNILTTKKANLNRHKDAIIIETLPKTFQDAIEITRHLGIRYLWIDSLCIIQDDLDDWAKESSKMASIYQNCYLTLAATAARDGSEGLFKPRDVETFSIDLSTEGSEDKFATLLARKGRKHACLRGVQEDQWINEDSEPLLTRAWVYQERLLSRRLLHFASDEMMWECQATTDCECGLMPKDEPITKSREENGVTDEGRMSDRSVFEILNSGEQQGTDAESQRWYQLIKNYTLLSITKDEDRLPAFSGIASSLIKAENYMAGIRKDHVVRDLLWFTRSSTNPRRSKSYLAPSWSWASVIGGFGNYTVMYDYPTQWEATGTQSLVEIKEISAIRSTTDPFGRVKGGELKVGGHCIKATISESDKKDWIGSSWGGHRLRVKISTEVDAAMIYELELDTLEDAYAAVGSSVTLLAIWLGRGRRTLHFLVLMRSSRLSRKLRRIGAMSMSARDQVDFKKAETIVENFLSETAITDLVLI